MPILDTIREITPGSLSMLYVWLPLLLAVFYIVPVRFRMIVLAVGSFGYAVLLQPQWVPLMFLSVAASYGCCYLMQSRSFSQTGRSFLVGACVFLNLGIFIFSGTYWEITSGAMILGSSVYPIMSMIGVLHCYSGQIERPMSFWDFSVECMFYPRLYAGPFTFFSVDTRESVEQAQLSLPVLIEGGGKLVWGAFLSRIVGYQLWDVFHSLQKFSNTEQSLLSSWLYVFVFSLALLFILGGYLAMAQGIGGLFGLVYPKSSKTAYQSSTMLDFFQRFHSSWRRVIYQYVYGPLSSPEDSRRKDSFLIVLSSMTFGIWFGFTFNYAIWGGIIGLFIAMEKHLYPEFFTKVPKVLGRLYVMLVVLLSFPVLTERTIGASGQLYRNLFFLSGGEFPLYQDNVLYLIRSNWLLLLVAVLLALGGAEYLKTRIEQGAPHVMRVIAPIGSVLLLVLVTALQI